MNKLRLYGLIGYPLSHSFSKKYFTNKFEEEGLDQFKYLNFEIDNIDKLRNIIDSYPNLIGLNVTIPYKQLLIPLLDNLSKQAEDIGAVNTICIDNTTSTRPLTGYNTDYVGFEKTLDILLKSSPKGALVLGTGGASKAVVYSLKNRGIKYISVSRNPGKNLLTYTDIDKKIIEDYPLIINTSPVGMYPDISNRPDIPYQFLGPNNYLIDLIYNPDQTLFLQLGKEAGAATLNGLPMLIAQAEASWELWNK